MINSEEKKVLRELAKKVKYYSEQPIMEKRKAKWYEHNDLKTTDPLVAVFPENSWHEIIPADSLLCEDELARKMEWLLRARIFKAETVDDDIPIEKEWDVPKIITDTGWDKKEEHLKNKLFGNDTYCDSCLGNMPTIWKKGFVFNGDAQHFEPVIEDYEDLNRLKTPEVIYWEKETMEELKQQQDILGDILNVRLVGKKHINCGLMLVYTEYRGLEQVYLDVCTEPEMLHDAMNIVTKGYHEMLDQYVSMGLLEVNNTQGYSGSGGMTYTHDLPKEPGGGKNLKNFWGFTESQEFCVVGPEKHYEFVMQYEKTFAERFGLISYGCCEPIENKLKYVLDFPGIRRISVSPWANIEQCAEKIGDKAVYSWKLNPSLFINNFDDKEKFAEYIKDMLEKTKNNYAEIILKDTGTCQNDPERFGEFVSLCRKLINEVRN